MRRRLDKMGLTETLQTETGKRIAPFLLNWTDPNQISKRLGYRLKHRSDVARRVDEYFKLWKNYLVKRRRSEIGLPPKISKKKIGKYLKFGEEIKKGNTRHSFKYKKINLRNVPCFRWNLSKLIIAYISENSFRYEHIKSEIKEIKKLRKGESKISKNETDNPLSRFFDDIDSKMLKNLDTRKRKISKETKAFLDYMFSDEDIRHFLLFELRDKTHDIIRTMENVVDMIKFFRWSGIYLNEILPPERIKELDKSIEKIELKRDKEKTSLNYQDEVESLRKEFFIKLKQTANTFLYDVEVQKFMLYIMLIPGDVYEEIESSINPAKYKLFEYVESAFIILHKYYKIAMEKNEVPHSNRMVTL